MQKNLIIEKGVFFIKYKLKNRMKIFDLPDWQSLQTSQHIFKQTWSDILENKIDSNRGWFIKRQTNSRSSDQEWQPVVQQVTTNDNEWYNE